MQPSVATTTDNVHVGACFVTAQVGPPPGGPVSVRSYIPVVFFTAKGIPGEVDERLDTREGIMAATARALGLTTSAAAAAAAAAAILAGGSPTGVCTAWRGWQWRLSHLETHLCRWRPVAIRITIICNCLF